MTDTGFHYEDIPPQEWLNELHSFNIPQAWDIQINNNQRTNLAHRAGEKLNGWRLSLREQMKKIEARYDSSKRDAMENMLAPYQMLDELGTDLHKQIRDLQDRVKAGRAIPQQFEFGTQIFGDLKSRRWKLGEQEDERRWRDFLSVERRYRTLTKEYKVQSLAYDNAKQRVNETKEDLKKLTENYEKYRGFLHLGTRLFIVLLTIAFCLLLGFVAFTIDFSLGAVISNEALGGIMMIFAVAGAIVAVVLARRRRETIAVLENDIAEMRDILEAVKKEAHRQRQYILPTRETVKEVRADYEVLKESFG